MTWNEWFDLRWELMVKDLGVSLVLLAIVGGVAGVLWIVNRWRKRLPPP